LLSRQQVKSLKTIEGRDGLMPGALQHLYEQLADGGFVVDDQNTGRP
jgi:hypothetical protein